MRRGDYVPERGDIVWLDFSPQGGHEQRGRRPAMILSPHNYNAKTSLCLCLPITSRVKGYPFEVALPDSLEIGGVILADQVKSLDFVARDAAFVCQAPAEVVEQVQRYVGVLVG